MNIVKSFNFLSNDKRIPYINNLIDYKISVGQDDNFIYFDGYYYVSDLEFPTKCFCTTVSDESNSESEHFEKNLESKFYEIEIYKREKLKDTSQSYETVDYNGSKTTLYCCPTHEQKIYFRIIREFNTFDEYLRRTKQVIKQE